ncbi:MAG: DNA gyrase inhibitor YacG [Planctomycetaceae bacterium]|nr:DNA gyrase inhibitor YacG [Planctomycetaceae bacterium]MCA9043159.1 DNA gyrase inhibitor YacG [Planctomycetaceae bacterium]
MIRPMTCPTCEKELPVEINGESNLFPFCSKRCKEIDLLRWMKGEYALVEPMTIDDLLQAEQQQEWESE